MSAKSFGGIFQGNGGQYSWAGVIEFLQTQERILAEKETEFLLEKQEFLSKIGFQEGELKAQEKINEDLLTRIKMLEYALRQERVRYARATGNMKGAEGASLQQPPFGPLFPLANLDLNQGPGTQPKIAKRRAKGHRPLLVKFLEEVGIEDIFKSTKEEEKLNIEEEIKQELDAREKERELAEEQKRAELEKITQSLPEEEKGVETIVVQKREKGEKTLGKESEGLTRNKLDTEELLQSEVVQGKKIWNPRHSLKSHMDSIRAVQFFESPSVLVSASEDCLIKLWDIGEIMKLSEQDHIEPYFTFRGHTGPLFSMCGGNESLNYLYSGGNEGIIRVWEVPQPADIEPYGPSDGHNYCLGKWKGHEDTIWDLTHHSIQNLLLSAGADGQVLLWKTLPKEETLLNLEKEVGDANLLKQFTWKSGSSHLVEIPTKISWIETDLNSFISGYVAPYLTIFDVETGKPRNSIRLAGDTPGSGSRGLQTNTIITHPSMNMSVSGHENNTIQFYDLNSGSEIKNIMGHTEAVSCLAFDRSGLELISGGYDGSLRCWDIRKYQCLDEIQAHRPKYEESVMALHLHPSLPLVASGGADSKLRIFEFNTQQS